MNTRMSAPSNCIKISTTSDINSPEIISKNTTLEFLPSLLLSNCMSITPKIDEISFVLHNQDIEIAFFSETWLKQSVPDSCINIENYRVFRRDRENRLHGGVCIYVKDSIDTNVLTELHNSEHEVLSLVLRPKRLPRGFSNIVVACLYHPPNADNMAMQEYLMSSLEFLESNFSNIAIILAGDFNQLNFKSAASKTIRLLATLLTVYLLMLRLVTKSCQY